MKKKLWISIGLLLVAITTWVIIYTYPQKLNYTIQGVMYQLGEENRDYAKPVAVSVKGQMKRSIVGVRTFTGVIDIEGEYIPVPEKNRELKLTLSNNDGAYLHYSYIQNGQLKSFTYGNLFVNDDFSKIAITKYTKTDPNNFGWNSGDGYMISAPAQNRDDALGISNELLKDYSINTLK